MLGAGRLRNRWCVGSSMRCGYVSGKLYKGSWFLIFEMKWVVSVI